MRDRWYRKGGSKPDPQVGAAAAANARVAQQAQDWNEAYFNKYVAPLVSKMTEESDFNMELNRKLAGTYLSQQELADKRYRELGIPAEDAYFAGIKQYTSPEEFASTQERMARAAIGDINTSIANQQSQQDRRMLGLGIDPTSPAARSAMTDMGIQAAALRAGAATRAREGAEATRIGLLGEAANVGRGMAANVTGFGGAATGAAGAGLQGFQNSAQIAPGGAANVNTGLGIAQKGYGANLDAYTEIQKARMAQPSGLAGIGQLVGTLGGAALGNPAGLSGIFGSDRRIKKAAQRVATLAHDIGLWMFRYIWEADDAPLRFGYMADEVEPVFPEAVLVGPDGIKLLDYSKVAI